MKAFVLARIRADDVKEVVCKLSNAESVTESHITIGPYDGVAVVGIADVVILKLLPLHLLNQCLALNKS